MNNNRLVVANWTYLNRRGDVVPDFNPDVVDLILQILIKGDA